MPFPVPNINTSLIVMVTIDYIRLVVRILLHIQGELIDCVDTEVMVDILKAVPEAAPSHELTSWISDIILPFVLEHLSLMLVSVIIE